MKKDTQWAENALDRYFTSGSCEMEDIYLRERVIMELMGKNSSMKESTSAFSFIFKVMKKLISEAMIIGNEEACVNAINDSLKQILKIDENIGYHLKVERDEDDTDLELMWPLRASDVLM